MISSTSPTPRRRARRGTVFSPPLFRVTLDDMWGDTVSHRRRLYRLRIDHRPTMVHAIAVIETAVPGQIISRVGTLAAWPYAGPVAEHPSHAVRALTRTTLATEGGTATADILISQEGGIPSFRIGPGCAPRPVSFAHHGGGIAFVAATGTASG